MEHPGHAGLAAYLRAQAMTEGTPRADGAIVLVFDRRYRVCCRPAPGGDLVLETQLGELPAEPQRCEEMFELALQHAASRLAEHVDAVALSHDERALMLQQRVAADASAGDVRRGLEAFTNSIAVWRRHLCVL
jgi:hypothetical protein